MKTTSAAHGGGLLLHPTPKSHRLPIFLFIPHHLRNSAVPKHLILHPLILCRSRRWDSNAETFRTQNFNFNGDEDEEEDDDDGEGGFPDFIDEFLDNIWILKVFQSYGWTFPPIILSILISSGLKAFLMALALPVGQSVLTFSFQKLWGLAQNKPRRKNQKRPRNRTPINNNVRRKGQRPSTRNGKTGYRPGTTRVYDSPSRNDQDAPTFGGWDELDQRRDFNMEPPQPSVGPSRRENGAPLLLRLLIAVFPFLSSWTKML
ncbi:PREDICTED: uncharacterized protein LOC109176136 isoform X2 [Ipomoea nil]|uniref:uncharacterized protein LOC109176136 isoform X2 n=1 Tax=Ipomoea nil TaxID=35883 RepID=UPI00090108AF|nr:PREDICTED: uncharacterized protein LOC109176136 isoform X2 [Ipomoea nil]